jgi:hypothetical protein
MRDFKYVYDVLECLRHLASIIRYRIFKSSCGSTAATQDSKKSIDQIYFFKSSKLGAVLGGNMVKVYM